MLGDYLEEARLAGVREQWISRAGELFDYWQEYANDGGWLVTDDAVVVREAALMESQSGPAGQWDGRAAAVARQTDFVLLSNAFNMLRAIMVLVAVQGQDAAVAPLLRALIECVGRACWVLDPQAGIRERVARVKLLWLDDHYQGRAAMTANKERRAYDKAIESARAELNGLFQPDEIVQPDRAESDLHEPLPTVAGQSLPGLRASARFAEGVRFDETPNLAKTYDVLSLLSHPNLAPIVQELTGQAGDVDDYEARTLREAMRVFIGAWVLVARYHGHELDEVRLRQILRDDFGASASLKTTGGPQQPTSVM